MTTIESAISAILKTSLHQSEKGQAILAVLSSEQNQPKPQFKPVKNPPQDTFVYLIENEQGHIKIGFSGNPEKRLSQLKTGCPSAKLLHKFIGTMQDEKHLQSLFSGKNIDKEWFRLNGGDIEEIKEYFEAKKIIRKSVAFAIDALRNGVVSGDFFETYSKCNGRNAMPYLRSLNIQCSQNTAYELVEKLKQENILDADGRKQ